MDTWPISDLERFFYSEVEDMWSDTVEDTMLGGLDDRKILRDEDDDDEDLEPNFKKRKTGEEKADMWTRMQEGEGGAFLSR